jgi:DNA polymerase I-like protein with 3'-5' exonuclease and polymerase domains
LATILKTFIRPWLAQAELSKGTVYPNWNQVRTTNTGGDAGAKTGRLSASRFMNAPKTPDESGISFPGLQLPALPRVRRYLLPDKGQVWAKRDFCGQELRVLAHFEDGEMLQAYQETPLLDVHQMVGDVLISKYGMFGGDAKRARTAAKTTVFGLIYGLGVPGLAEKLGLDIEEAKAVQRAVYAVLPGLEGIKKATTRRGETKGCITTWGGRVYYAEPGRYVEAQGRVQTFSFRLLNYLIQGSSADATKEAIIRYDAVRKHGRLLVTVHDELDISVPREHLKSELEILRRVMASLEFDVLMLSDAEVGATWGDLKKYADPKPLLERPKWPM